MDTLNHAQDPSSVVTAAKPPRKLVTKRCRYSGCNKKFTQAHWRQDFCQDQCRFDFHKNGAAFGVLAKQGISKLVKLATKELLKMLPKLTAKFLTAQQKETAQLKARVIQLEKDLAELYRAVDAVKRKRSMEDKPFIELL